MALLRLPVLVLRWTAVIVAVLAWIVVVPVVEVARAAFARLFGRGEEEERELDAPRAPTLRLLRGDQWQEPDPESRNVPPASGTNSQA